MQEILTGIFLNFSVTEFFFLTFYWNTYVFPMYKVLFYETLLQAWENIQKSRKNILKILQKLTFLTWISKIIFLKFAFLHVLFLNNALLKCTSDDMLTFVNLFLHRNHNHGCMYDSNSHSWTSVWKGVKRWFKSFCSLQ